MSASQLDVKQTHLVHQWKHTAPLIACRFHPDGKSLWTSSEDYALERWEFPSGKKTSWPAHESWIKAIAFLAEGEAAVTVGCDEKMVVWPANEAQPKPSRELHAHDGWIRTVSASNDGKWLATGGNDKKVKLWAVEDLVSSGGGSKKKDSLKAELQLDGHTLDVYSTFFHPDGKHLLSGDLAGEVRQWEIASGKFIRKFEAKELHTYNGGQGVHYGGVRGIALNTDGKHLACCGLHKATNPLGAVNEPLALVFEWESQKKVRSHVAAGVRGIGWDAEFLSDGTLLCVSGGSGGGFLLFWKPDTDKEHHKFKLPNTARGMALHPDGLQLATVHYDRQVRISRMAKKQT